MSDWGKILTGAYFCTSSFLFCGCANNHHVIDNTCIPGDQLDSSTYHIDETHHCGCQGGCPLHFATNYQSGQILFHEKNINCQVEVVTFIFTHPGQC